MLRLDTPIGDAVSNKHLDFPNHIEWLELCLLMAAPISFSPKKPQNEVRHGTTKVFLTCLVGSLGPYFQPVRDSVIDAEWCGGPFKPAIELPPYSRGPAALDEEVLEGLRVGSKGAAKALRRQLNLAPLELGVDWNSIRKESPSKNGDGRGETSLPNVIKAWDNRPLCTDSIPRRGH